MQEKEIIDAEALTEEPYAEEISAEGAEFSDNEAAAEPNSEEAVPKAWIDRIRLSVYKNETTGEIMKISSYAIVALCVYALFMRFMALAELGSLIDMIKLAAVLGIPFIAVSIIRYLINAPRPYEVLEFYEKKPKKREGRSFPSRHVFSMFLIGVILVASNPAVGIGLIILGAVLAFVRVAQGIHFLRDVVAGAIIGAVSGGIGLLIII